MKSYQFFPVMLAVTAAGAINQRRAAFEGRLLRSSRYLRRP